MNDITRVEIPLVESSRILSSYNTIGDLRKAYPDLRFVKYIYKDPKDQKLKGRNPSDELPLVENAFITVIGNINKIVEFSEGFTNK